MSTYPALLRALADLIEEHGLVELPHTLTDHDIGIHAYGEDAPQRIAAWRRALGGTWRKGGGDDYIVLSQRVESLPGAPTVDLFIGKDRCVRRVVGTETVTVPAVEAQPERIEERELIEWDCDPVLAGVAA